MTDEDGNPVDPEDGIKELADVVINWHQSRIDQLDEILDSAKDGKGLKLKNEEDDSEIVIEGDKLAGFRAGLHVAKLILGKLPFTMQDPTQSWDEEAEEELTEEEPDPVRPADFGHFS